jgi:hypothetical protein
MRALFKVKISFFNTPSADKLIFRDAREIYFQDLIL